MSPRDDGTGMPEQLFKDRVNGGFWFYPERRAFLGGILGCWGIDILSYPHVFEYSSKLMDDCIVRMKIASWSTFYWSPGVMIRLQTLVWHFRFTNAGSSPTNPIDSHKMYTHIYIYMYIILFVYLFVSLFISLISLLMMFALIFLPHGVVIRPDQELFENVCHMFVSSACNECENHQGKSLIINKLMSRTPLEI